MKHKLSFSALALLFSLSLRSQTNADSLLKILPGSTDTTRVNVLNSLGFEYCENDPDKALAFSREAILLSGKIGFQIGKAKAFNNAGIIYDVTGNYDSALFYYNSSLEISTSLDNKKQIANTLNNIGLVEWNKGEYEKALHNFLSSLKIFETLGNKKGQANTLSNIGLIYTDLKKHPEALQYHQRVLKLREQLGDNYGIGVSLTNLGIAYSNINEPEKAIESLKKSLIVKEENNDLYGLAISLTDVGVVYSEAGNYEEAIKYYLRSLPIRIKLDDKYGLITTYNNLSGAYNKKKDHRIALDYSLRSLALANELKSKSKLKTVYRDLSYCYKQLNDHESALNYYEKYAALNDSIYSEESARQIAELQTRYETEKKDLELERKDLELSKNQLEIAQQKTQRNILLISLLVLLIIGLLLYNRYKLKQENLLHEERNAQQEIRSKAIIEAEENERTRIARELHDGIGQQLSAVKLNLSSLESTLDKKDAEQAIFMKNALEMINDSVKEVRAVSHSMMPNALLKSGLASAVREFLNRISHSGKIKIELEISGLNERLESVIESILFRVIQESVNNIIKHSGASIVNIQIIRYEDELNMMIEDNGKGFDPSSASAGIGLKNIRSRIEFINGTVNFDSSPGKGTTISIEIPIKTLPETTQRSA
ncbi:MAG TPA: sensor histidine kinase [Bacteroidia bacterium]|jgi:signal transduction histidine kinase